MKPSASVAATDDFLQSILALPAVPRQPNTHIVDQLYTTLVDSNAYDETTCLWSGFPVDDRDENDNDTKNDNGEENDNSEEDDSSENNNGEENKKNVEDVFRGPFVAAASAINQACRHLDHFPVQLWSSWIDKHSTASTSRDDDISGLLPGIVAVLGTEEEHQEWESEAALNLGAASDAGGGTPTEVKAKQEKGVARAHWLRVHVPVEIKSDDGDIAPAVGRLCRMMRQIFREQVDRRFVLGLVFCKSELSVWLCDRLGLLGTQTPFNIHEEPKKFIQVVAALALLNPQRLGWDTSMRLYRPSSPTAPFVHSYYRSVRFEHFHGTLDETHWAIDMPSRDGSDRETFISIHRLSMARSEVMHGRATIVWEVVRHNDIGGNSNGNIQRYVLKQGWRAMGMHKEASFYRRLPSGDDHVSANVGKLYSSEDVEIAKGVRDTTSRIRHKLTTTPLCVPGYDATAEEAVDVQSASGTTTESTPLTDTKAPPRVLSRLLMETYGWPIKFFKDIPELLRVIRDALRGHQDLYYKAGVLHRDISIGNILICPEDDVGKKTHGRIIDLDYAKLTNKYFDPVRSLPTQEWDEDMKDDHTHVNTLLKRKFRCHIDEAAFFELYNRFKGRKPGALVNYVDEVIHYRDLSRDKNEQVSSCRMLSSSGCTRAQPDFSEHALQKAPRTATVPFASYEVLANLHYDGPNNKPVIHNSIHDVEALFWVSQNVCLTRDGPGGSRRRELKVENCGGDLSSLEKIVFCFFDSPTDVVANNRRVLFTSFDDLESIIMPHFHPYFDSLKPLMLEWSYLLRMAYTYRSYTPNAPVPTLYRQIIAAIEKTLQEIESTAPSTPQPATIAELQRRRLHLGRVQEFRRQVKKSAATKSAVTQYTTVGAAEVDLLGLSPDRARSDVRDYTAVGPPDSPTQGQPPKKKPTIRK
ncbi:hypothetical protein B0H21DRAFT_809283 [Amylocystis lapponica]|nr:hypothetical protein B0H21DRAFT_809283 [Amylocystis lapponica]